MMDGEHVDINGSRQQQQQRRPSITTTKLPHNNGASKTTETEEPPEPHLDSGYAWIILAIMFLINSSIGGSTRVYGLLYAKQVAVGYYTHEEASWPVITTSAVENLAGILTPALATVISWRQIELISALLMVLSNLFAYFSDSLLIDTLCLGLLQGFALSMSSILGLAINNEYFRRYRTTTFGLALSGSTSGVLYLEPLISWVLDTHSNFRCAYLALAAVFCANVLLVLLVERRHIVAKSAFWSRLLPAREQPADHAHSTAVTRKTSVLEVALRSRESSVAGIDLRCNTRRISSWAPPPPPSGRTNQWGVAGASGASLRESPSSGSMAAAPDWLEVQQRKWSSVVESREHRKSRLEAQLPVVLLEDGSRGNWRKPSSNLSNSLSFRDVDLDQTGGGEAQPQQQPQQQAPELPSEPFSKLLLSLLSSPFLHCAWIMLALYYLVSRICILILVDFASDRGLSSSSARSLLNYWSLGELCGRIVLSSFIDLRWLSIKSCVALTCATLGLTLGLLVVVESFVCYALCVSLSAALISLEYVLINALIIEYMGQTKVTSCYSLASFICSLLLFARPAIIGFFRDRLGSYDGLLLCLAGSSLAYAILFWTLEPLFRRMARKTISGGGGGGGVSKSVVESSEAAAQTGSARK